MTVLGEEIDHHVEEEEGPMFRKAKRARVDVVQLGEKMQARKTELMPAEESTSTRPRLRRH